MMMMIITIITIYLDISAGDPLEVSGAVVRASLRLGLP